MEPLAASSSEAKLTPSLETRHVELEELADMEGRERERAGRREWDIVKERSGRSGGMGWEARDPLVAL